MDIALLKLSEPIVVSANVAIIRISNQYVVPGDELRGFGWSCWFIGILICQLTVVPQLDTVFIPTGYRYINTNAIAYNARQCGLTVENGPKFCTYSSPLGVGTEKGFGCNVSILSEFTENCELFG